MLREPQILPAELLDLNKRIFGRLKEAERIRQFRLQFPKVSMVPPQANVVCPLVGRVRHVNVGHQNRDELLSGIVSREAAAQSLEPAEPRGLAEGVDQFVKKGFPR